MLITCRFLVVFLVVSRKKAENMKNEESKNITEQTEEPVCREMLLDIIISIHQEQMPLEMNDMILMCLKLDTKPKADKFVQWIGRHLNNGKLESNPDRILSAATRIGRGMEPND